MADAAPQAVPGRVVEEAWQRYRAAVLPSDATALEIEAQRLCFISGALAVFSIIVREAAGPGSSDEALAELLFTIGAELQELDPHA